MVNILAICPNVNDATSFYRAAWPLSRIVKKYPNEFSVVFQKANSETTLGWAELSGYDILFIQRAYTNWNLDLINIAKALGVKVWVDYDDNLFEVPFHNASFKTYSNPKVKDTISKIIKNSDLATFSTSKLMEQMRCENKNTHVVRNATDMALDAMSKSFEINNIGNTIFWRGSNTHHSDLYTYADSIGMIADEFPDWKFIFLGEPWFGMQKYIKGKQFIVLPPVPIPSYFSFIKTLQPAITMVPLEESIFNKCKSNIAWQEATQAGSACLVPDWEEWNCPGTTVYRDKDSFYRKLKYMIQNEEYRKGCVQDSRKILDHNFDLEFRNDERAILLNKLCFT